MVAEKRKANDSDNERDMSDDSQENSRSASPFRTMEQYQKDRKKIRDDLQTKAVAMDKQKEADTIKRYAYLLGQTELFRHFLKNSALPEAQIQQLTSKAAQNRLGDRRHRKTEMEEDEELLKEEEEPEDAPDIFTSSPEYVKGGTMRDYQVQGLNWLISLYHNGINGVLADEMGLGKTLQTISFLGYLKHLRGINGPHMVLVPKSTLHNWVSEFNKWVPDINVMMFHGNKEERASILKNKVIPGDFEVMVTSFEMCLIEKAQLRKISWQFIAIDEAHRVKNENSMLSQIVRTLNCRNRLLLTGTPLQNNLHELWALLNFLLPDVFRSADDFDSWFQTQGGDQERVVEQLQKVLRPFLLRRVKADVEKSLLPKKRINLYVGMSSMQKQWYRKILEKDLEAVNGIVGARDGKTRLQNVVMQLRKCCNHPYLFSGAEPGPPYTTDQHIIDNAGKMVLLDKLLQRLRANGSRVLIFSQMSRVLDILEDYCLWKQYEYCRIDGQTAHEDRVSQIDEFNRENSSKFIFLLTTRAGGLGINLATADIVIMYDSDWNPQVDLQAEDRAHRIGQKKQVVVFRFITDKSYEERVIEKATQKLRLDQLVIQQGKAVNQAKGATKDDLLQMIQHGAEDVFKNTDSTISDDAIEEIMRRGEEKTAELEGKYGSMGLEDLQLLSIEGSGGNAYQWEGKDYANASKKREIGMNWIAPAKRERKTNYSVDDYYRDAMRTSDKQGGSSASTSRGPRVPKAVNYNDFQFFPKELYELAEQEKLLWRKANGKPVVKKQPGDDGYVNEEEAEEERAREQAKMDASVPLTEEQVALKEELLKQGFENWSKRDFNQFVKACERHGRNRIQQIADEIDGKTFEEVEAYAKVFWVRYQELNDWQRIISKIEEGEQKIRRFQDIQSALTNKVKKLKLPLQQLKISYGQNKGKSYTEEEDRFLLVALERLGYGSEDVYELIRQEIRDSPLFRFDWFLKSRTSQEIARRCNTLVSLITKENLGK